MSERVYVDTSALIKRYLAEAGSDEFDAFFVASAPLHTSRLALTEARSALARRRLSGAIDADLEFAIGDALRRDIQDGAWVVLPCEDRHVAEAHDLIEQQPVLRTLDAMHLAIAREMGAATLATADCGQARAAQALGLSIRLFCAEEVS